MKKILSIILAFACIFCIVSCGEGDNKISPSSASTFEEVCEILESNAETFTICDEAEIDKFEKFFSGGYNDYSDSMYAMCYAKMSDGKYVRCIDMLYDIDAEIFNRTYASNYDYIVYRGTIVIFGTSSFIEEFKA